MPPFHNSNDTALDKTSRTNLDDSTKVCFHSLLFYYFNNEPDGIENVTHNTFGK
jgi:hypothetical protein